MPALQFDIKDINQFFKYLEDISNKNQVGGKFGLDVFNEYLPIANWRKFKQKHSIPEEFQVGQPFSRQAYELSQSNIDSTSRFKVVMGVDAPPMYLDSEGYGILPTDYVHFSSARFNWNLDFGECKYDSKSRRIEPLTNAEWYDRCDSPIKPPSYKYPILQFLAGRIQVLPKDLQVIDFVYLRKPATPFLDYTLNQGTDDYTYNQATSVQLEWAENDIIDIGSMILEMIATENRDQMLYQTSDKSKKEGL